MKKTYISSVALYDVGTVDFGGASIASVLPKTREAAPVVIFKANPLDSKVKGVLVELSDLNDQALKKTAVAVLDGKALVVVIETITKFSSAGKAYEKILSFSAPAKQDVASLVEAAQQAKAISLANSSEAKLKEASSFHRKPGKPAI
jgi:hypothetical protein